MSANGQGNAADGRGESWLTDVDGAKAHLQSLGKALQFATYAQRVEAKGDLPEHGSEEMDDSALAWALRYAGLSWFVFPAPSTGEKKSHKSAEHSPTGRRWGATNDLEEIKRDFKQWPDACVGIPAGLNNGNPFFVIEADTKEGHGKDGLASFQALEARHGKLPETLTGESPSGSIHRYYKHPGGYILSKALNGVPGVDIKADGGMVIAPPSIRPGVGEYKWLNWGTDIADAPDWLIKLVRENDAAKDYQKHGDEYGSGGTKYVDLIENILTDTNGLHDSTRDLAAKLVVAGMDGDAVVNLVRGVMEQTPEPLRDKRWQERWGDIPNLVTSAERKYAEPEPKIVSIPLINISGWDDEPVPQQEWAVADRIPLNKTAIFSGEGAAGKSLLQLHLSVAHVLGKEWLGVTPRQGSAMFIDAEDDEPVLHKRLADILRHYGVRFADVAQGLHLVSLSGEDAVLGLLGRKSGKIEPTALYHKLLEMVGDLKPTMIGIASSADVFAGNEIDRGQVQQFIAHLTKIAKVANGSMVLISHPSLTGISSGSGLSGSTQWHNSVRARFYLKTPKSTEGEQPDTDLRMIEFKKNNYGRVSESITLRYQDGLFLPVPDSTLDREVRRDRAKEMFLQVLQRFTTENRKVSATPGPTYAPKLFASELEATCWKLAKEDLAGAMRDLLREGKVVQEQYGRPTNPHFRLVIP
jgi:RecA-family ATPase